MYPSLIISKNICFTTRDDSGTNVSPVGVHFLTKEQKPGILPTMMSNLMRTRDETKAKMKSAKSPEEARYYDGLQAAVKVLMNSFYGCSPPLLPVHRPGHRFLHHSVRQGEDQGHHPTAGGRGRPCHLFRYRLGVRAVLPRQPQGSIEFGTGLAERFSKEGGSLSSRR